MTFKYVLPIIALTASASIAAEEYQVFTEFNADNYRFSGNSETNWDLKATYFFDKKQTLGPLDQFEYINKVTNIGASFSRQYDENIWTVGGEYFAENNLVVSANHSRTSDFNVSRLGLGYLISDNFIVRAEAIKPKDTSTTFLFSASYDHKLENNNDYIGFTAQVDDEFDYFSVSTKYFASLGEANYIALGLGIEDFDGTTDWNIEADYYFNKMTSLGIEYDKSDDIGINAKHYFNTNWALSAGFSSNTDTSDLKVYSLGVIGQF